MAEVPVLWGIWRLGKERGDVLIAHRKDLFGVLFFFLMQGT